MEIRLGYSRPMDVCVMIVNSFISLKCFLQVQDGEKSLILAMAWWGGRNQYTRARVRQIASRILANSRVRDYFVRPTFAKIRDYSQSSPIDNFLSIQLTTGKNMRVCIKF